MPTYTYRCHDCGSSYEVIALKLGDRVDTDCPFCKSRGTHKVFTPTVIIYKTDGFYTTDSRKDKNNGK